MVEANKMFRELDKIEEYLDFTGEIAYRHPVINLKRGIAIVHPFFRSVCARVEYYVVGRAREMGERIIDELQLYRGSQGGITINWVEVRKRVYVPRLYTTLTNKVRPPSIFSQDEGQGGDITSYTESICYTHPELTDKVLKPDYEEKIRLLTTDEDWRKQAELFAITLITKCRESLDKRPTINQSDSLTTIVKDLVDTYMRNMEIKR